MDQITLAVAGSVVAGIVSLVVAYINLRSSRRLNQLSRQYDLLKLDLERLGNLSTKISSVLLPNLPTPEQIAELTSEELNAELQRDHDRVAPHFTTVADAMLQARTLFSDATQAELRRRIQEAQKANNVQSLLAKFNFIVWAAEAVDQQVANVRRQWTKI